MSCELSQDLDAHQDSSMFSTEMEDGLALIYIDRYFGDKITVTVIH